MQEKLNNEINNFYSSPLIIKVITRRRVRCIGPLPASQEILTKVVTLSVPEHFLFGFFLISAFTDV